MKEKISRDPIQKEKKTKSGVVVHACNPSNWEAEAGGS
jgi:hypothetical protein